MFRIEYVKLDDYDKYFFDRPSTFIFGKNNVGKSLLVEILDYMLGSSRKAKSNIWLLAGMDNIKYLECKIKVENEKYLFLKREANNLFFKRIETDGFQKVTMDTYKELIQESFSDKSLINEQYYESVSEILTYRSFSYVNFLRENQLGSITDIFNNKHDIKVIKRLKKQMNFLFDYGKLMERNALQEKIEYAELELKKLIVFEERKKILEDDTVEILKKLALPIKTTLKENEETFNNFLSNSFDIKNEKKSLDDKNLLFLMNASNVLNNQININIAFKQDASKFSNQLSNNIKLLNFFKNSIKNQENQKYIDIVSEILLEEQFSKKIINLKDYDKTIDKLIEKKKKIDDDIEKINVKLNEMSYVDKLILVNSFKNNVALIKKIPNLELIEEKKKNLVSLKEDLKKITDSIGALGSSKFNDDLNNYYKLIKNTEFSNEDEKINFLKINFFPLHNSLEAQCGDKKDNKIIYKIYAPGSKARFTTWQIIAFVVFHKFIKENFNKFPMLPILVIDGFHEPYDEESIDSVYKVLKQMCNDNNIQLIVTSTRSISQKADIDLSNGLNSQHGKKVTYE